MGPACPSGGALHFQYVPRRRIPVSRTASAENEWFVWQKRLDREWHSLRVVSPASALGPAGEHPFGLATGVLRQTLSQQLVPYPHPFRAKHLLHCHHLWFSAWPGV